MNGIVPYFPPDMMFFNHVFKEIPIIKVLAFPLFCQYILDLNQTLNKNLFGLTIKQGQEDVCWGGIKKNKTGNKIEQIYFFLYICRCKNYKQV
jgi:hypothetical protein